MNTPMRETHVPQGARNNQSTAQESTMRTLNDHKVNPANDTLTITAVDEPGSGGAHHRYEISGFVMDTNPAGKYPRDFGHDGDYGATRPTVIVFQNGPINEVGINGLTHEALLAIVADRLRSFQAGPFACKANACALTHIEEAMHWLQQRTIERMRRGVEGTHAV